MAPQPSVSARVRNRRFQGADNAKSSVIRSNSIKGQASRAFNERKRQDLLADYMSETKRAGLFKDRRQKDQDGDAFSRFLVERTSHMRREESLAKKNRTGDREDEDLFQHTGDRRDVADHQRRPSGKIRKKIVAEHHFGTGGSTGTADWRDRLAATAAAMEEASGSSSSESDDEDTGRADKRRLDRLDDEWTHLRGDILRLKGKEDILKTEDAFDLALGQLRAPRLKTGNVPTDEATETLLQNPPIETEPATFTKKLEKYFEEFDRRGGSGKSKAVELGCDAVRTFLTSSLTKNKMVQELDAAGSLLHRLSRLDADKMANTLTELIDSNSLSETGNYALLSLSFVLFDAKSPICGSAYRFLTRLIDDRRRSTESSELPRMKSLLKLAKYYLARLKEARNSRRKSPSQQQKEVDVYSPEIVSCQVLNSAEKLAQLAASVSNSFEPMRFSAMKKARPAFVELEPDIGVGGGETRERREATQLKRRRQAVRKEYRGAVRELRRDNEYLARHQLAQQVASDAEREQKTRRIIGLLGEQEGQARKEKLGL